MVKGTAKKETSFKNTLYTGFTKVEVKALNPTKRELNALLGREDQDDDKEIEYLGEDKDGNTRLRMAFWLYSESLDKFFSYSFNLTKKERTNKDGNKYQFINDVCMTSWAEDKEGLAPWFISHLDKNKEEVGSKKFRKALMGEEEIATLLRGWLGRLSWFDPETSVEMDTNKLFREDYSDFRSLINGEFDAPFVALLGVKTDDNDNEKQYQQVYGKSFLPGGFMNYINKGFKFPTDFSKKTWKRFEDEVTGEYGFSSFFELEPLKEYDRSLDPAIVEGLTPVDDTSPSSSRY